MSQAEQRKDLLDRLAAIQADLPTLLGDVDSPASAAFARQATQAAQSLDEVLQNGTSDVEKRDGWLHRMSAMERQMPVLLGSEDSPGGMSFATKAASLSDVLDKSLRARVPRQPPPSKGPAPHDAQPPQKKTKKTSESEPHSKAVRRQKAINNRVGAAMAAANKAGISVESFLDRLSNGISDVRALEREDLALAEAVRGYEPLSKNKWARAVRRVVAHTQSGETAEWLTRWEHNTLGGDIHGWLAKTNSLLESHSVSNRALQLTTHIMEAMGAVQFAQVWADETKASKTKALRRMFIELEGERDKFDGLDAAAVDALLKGNRKAAFETWKGKIGFVTAARNKLAQAYKEFGPQVLINPFWSTTQLHAHKRTDDWPAVFSDLIKNSPHDADSPETPVYDHRYAQNYQAVVGIVHGLDEDLCDYVREFMRKFPSNPRTRATARQSGQQ
ncbi:hypothetical protein R3P38DRAFT_3545167 [Favolaschia claudopus]|uniref:Uncharacterized protein n=1 Tax=Favolaschia claudopus TaxID=2862362 RepID=A0AAW0E0E9_9AGAR